MAAADSDSGVVPAFLGESHFAFLEYAKNFRQTPIRRHLDYLRILGGSKEAAKELKLFGLGSFLTGRFTELSDEIYRENVELIRTQAEGRRASDRAGNAWLLHGICMGGLAYRPWGTVHWNLYFLAGAILQASNNIQQIFSTASSIADQALFLTDLLAFFAMQPTIRSKPNALPAPRPIVRGFEFRDVSFAYPGQRGLCWTDLNFTLRPGERVALIGENGEGKTTIVKLLTRLYDPTDGQILLDGVDLRDYRHRRSLQGDRRYLSGFHAL